MRRATPGRLVFPVLGPSAGDEEALPVDAAPMGEITKQPMVGPAGGGADVPPLSELTLDQKIAQLLGLSVWPDGELDVASNRVLRYVAAHGVGHVHLNRGTLGQVRRACELLDRLSLGASGVPILYGADVEQGVPQSFAHGSEVPWQQAIGATGRPEHSRRVGRLVGRETRELGVHVSYGPCADVLSEPRNKLLASRAFGTDPADVASHVAAWTEGAHAAGLAVCVKHYPGHGGAVEDSHLVLPEDPATLDELRHVHLPPFRAAIAAGAEMVMTGHVVFGQIDPGVPATLSRRLLRDVLRDELGFDGVVVTDSLNMHAIKRHLGLRRSESAVQALLAGADIVLHPGSPSSAHAALRDAVASGRLPLPVVDAAVERVLSLKRGVLGRASEAPDPAQHARWIEELAAAGVRRLGAAIPAIPAGARVRVLAYVDDKARDIPCEDAVSDALSAGGVQVERCVVRGTLRSDEVTELVAWAGAPGSERLVLAVLCPMYWFKGRALLEPETAAGLQLVVAAARPAATLVLAGPEAVAAQLGFEAVLCVYGPAVASQRAAAAALLGGRVSEQE